MRWKQSLTPLAAMSNLDAEYIDKLAAHYITTTEELVGQIEASPDGIAELLQIDNGAVSELRREALDVSNPEIVKSMEGQRGQDYKLGARLGRPPKDKHDG